MSFLSTVVREILEQGPFCAVATQESEPGGATFTERPRDEHRDARRLRGGVALTDAVLATRES